MASYNILSIEVGSYEVKAAIYDENAKQCGFSHIEFGEKFPDPFWVEQDAEEIWEKTLLACRQATSDASIEISNVITVGISCHRDTVLLWNKKTHAPIYKAINWQDRRTSALCAHLKKDGHEQYIQGRTGLVLDPHFCAPKIAWVLDNVSGARKLAARGDLAFGTMDSFILWRLTNGKVHATDASNASRTMLYNLHEKQWDEELLRLFNIPREILPEVKDSSDDFGFTNLSIFGSSIPISSLIGNQQASLLGHGCIKKGMTKSSLSAESFTLVNIGDQPIISKNRLLTTVAYQIDGHTYYALEGAIYSAGASLKWLHSAMNLLLNMDNIDKILDETDERNEIYMVPAFCGLGAPWWDSQCRAAIHGLTHNCKSSDLVRAAIEASCFQLYDLYQAIQRDMPEIDQLLDQNPMRVDGTITNSTWFMQRLSDLLDLNIERPHIEHTATFGSAILAGLYIGLYDNFDKFNDKWEMDQRFTPAMSGLIRKMKHSGWKNAVRRTLSDYKEKT